MIKLSFVLPCYNTGKYVIQCLDSLYQQCLHDEEFEIICVDDCSTDNTVSIIEEYALMHKQVKLVKHLSNLGSGGAYNTGIRVSQGEYIWFVDSDDYLNEGAAQFLLEVMDCESLEVIQFNLIPFSENGYFKDDKLRFNGNLRESTVVIDGVGYLSLLSSFPGNYFNYMPVPAYRKIYRRSFILDNNLFFTPTTVGTDYLQNMQMLLCTRRMKHLNHDYYCFRINQAGVTKGRMTVNKMVFASNNYSMSCRCIKQSNLPYTIKNKIISTIVASLNSYVSYLPLITLNEKKYFISQIQDRLDLINYVDSYKKRFFIRYPFFLYLFSFIVPPVMYQLLIKFKRIWRC